MFNNLEAEIKRKGYTQKKLANELGCNVTTLSFKLNGKTAFTLPEAKKLKEILSVDMPIEYLFQMSPKNF